MWHSKKLKIPSFSIVQSVSFFQNSDFTTVLALLASIEKWCLKQSLRVFSIIRNKKMVKNSISKHKNETRTFFTNLPSHILMNKMRKKKELSAVMEKN